MAYNGTDLLGPYEAVIKISIVNNKIIVEKVANLRNCNDTMSLLFFEGNVRALQRNA